MLTAALMPSKMNLTSGLDITPRWKMALSPCAAERRMELWNGNA